VNMTRPLPEDRPLSTKESSLVQWMLEHGNPDSACFLTQVDEARVVSRCPCGCASIDFAIGGFVPPTQSRAGETASISPEPLGDCLCTAQDHKESTARQYALVVFDSAQIE
jgi:hypothetical protein